MAVSRGNISQHVLDHWTSRNCTGVVDPGIFVQFIFYPLVHKNLSKASKYLLIFSSDTIHTMTSK